VVFYLVVCSIVVCLGWGWGFVRLLIGYLFIYKAVNYQCSSFCSILDPPQQMFFHFVTTFNLL